MHVSSRLNGETLPFLNTRTNGTSRKTLLKLAFYKKCSFIETSRKHFTIFRAFAVSRWKAVCSSRFRFWYHFKCCSGGFYRRRVWSSFIPTSPRFSRHFVSPFAGRVLRGKALEFAAPRLRFWISVLPPSPGQNPRCALLGYSTPRFRHLIVWTPSTQILHPHLFQYIRVWIQALVNSYWH